MQRKTSLLLGMAAASALAGSAMAVPQDTMVGAGVPIGSASPLEAVLYDNVPTGVETVFTTTSVPRTGGADEALFNGPAALLTSMQFGYSVATGGPAAFDARIRLWDDIEPTGSTVAGIPQFQNLKADFTLPFTAQTAGAFITAPVPLTTLPGGGATVTSNPATLGVPNVTDVYFQVDFFQPGTTTPVLNNAVTFIFDGTGANTGFTFSSPVVGGDGTAVTELYWRDVNGNSIISVDEARNFAAPNRANMVLHFEGNIIPEPATASLVGLGLGAMALRRRRA